MDAELFKTDERARIIDRSGKSAGYDLVAAKFAFVADGTREPPGDRVEEEEGFGGDLESVDEEIVSLNVSEFVKDERFDLRGGEPSEDGGWQKDERLEVADHSRRVRKSGCGEPDRFRNAEF